MHNVYTERWWGQPALPMCHIWHYLVITSYAFLCVTVLEFYSNQERNVNLLSSCWFHQHKGVYLWHRERHSLSSCRAEGRAESPKVQNEHTKINLKRCLRNIQEHSELPDLPPSCVYGPLHTKGCQGTAQLDISKEGQSTKHAWMYRGSRITWFAFSHLLFTWVAKLLYKLISLCLNNKTSFSVSKLCIHSRVRGN